MSPEQRKFHDDLIQAASDKGLVLATGWYACYKCMNPDSEHTNDLRLAYYAGAQHLFASIMIMLDPDSEPTERDLEKMTKIYEEMQEVEPELKLRGIVTKGNA